MHPPKPTRLTLCFSLLVMWSAQIFCANFSPVNVTELVTAIEVANGTDEDDVIDLGGRVFMLTVIDNNTNGNNGLPSIVSGSGTLTIQNGTIDRSSVSLFRLLHVAAGASLILDGVTLTDGLLGAGAFPNNCGGAIYNAGTLTITNSVISDNQTTINGGAICNSGTIDAILDSTISNNQSDFGGGIYNDGTITNISATTFAANTANERGGAIFNNEDSLITKITASTFENNTAVFRGGAIFNDGVAGPDAVISLIENSTFESNTATDNANGFGGAIFNGAIITTITGSTFSANVADASGGAIFQPGAVIEGFNSTGTIGVISNSTFSANVATNLTGGAISNNVGATITSIRNSTIVFNTAGTSGGGIYNASVISNFNSNIVAENEAPVGPDITVTGAGFFTNAPTFNLIGINSGNPIVNGVNNNQVGTLVSTLDPLLGPLTNNGGLTETHALLPNSPAINAGTNVSPPLTFDQRGAGFLRERDGQTDIGAFEIQTCDFDNDNDGACDDQDNCPNIPNTTQADADTDGVGDLCDNCVIVANADQANADSDQFGDVCDECINDALNDIDNDGFCGDVDNCPAIANDQTDTDNDNIGDACDICSLGPNNVDTDGDGVPDACDVCPDDATNECVGGLVDTDNDKVPDTSDNCPNIPNAGQENQDNDEFGDACDTCTDSDGDGVGDSGFIHSGCPISSRVDNCPFTQNAEQLDTDNDGIGNACDSCAADGSNDDDDEDGICNAADRCPGFDDALDEDEDGVADECDNCIDDFNVDQLDVNANGVGDACDDSPLVLIPAAPPPVLSGVPLVDEEGEGFDEEDGFLDDLPGWDRAPKSPELKQNYGSDTSLGDDLINEDFEGSGCSTLPSTSTPVGFWSLALICFWLSRRLKFAVG